MTVVVTERTPEIVNTNAGDAFSVTSGSFTPTANSLLIAVVSARGVSVDAVFSGGGLTWEVISGQGNNQTTVAKAVVGSSPGSMAVTATWTGDSPTGFALSVFQATGEGLVVRQAKTVVTPGLSGNSIPFDFDLALDTLSGYIIAGGVNGDDTPNGGPPTGWTEVMNGGHLSPATGYVAALRNQGETGTSYPYSVNTMSGVTAWLSGIEIAEESFVPITVMM